MIVFAGTRVGTSATGVGGNDCEVIGDRAGIARLWAVPCAAIAGLTFNRDRLVTAISFQCDVLSDEWVEILFDSGTGQFQQVQRGVNRYDQTISVTISGQSAYNRRQINALTSCSCWHFVVLDEGGTYHYAGVQTYDRGSLTKWDSATLSTSGNSATTGSDPTSGSNNFQLVLTAPSVHQLAPHLDGAPNELTGDCQTGTPPSSGGTGTGSNDTGGGDTGTGGSGIGSNPGDPGNLNNWQSPDDSDWQSPDDSAWYT